MPGQFPRILTFALIWPIEFRKPTRLLGYTCRLEIDQNLCARGALKHRQQILEGYVLGPKRIDKEEGSRIPEPLEDPRNCLDERSPDVRLDYVGFEFFGGG